MTTVFQDSVAPVTGAYGGIGQAVCATLRGAGVNVVGTGRSHPPRHLAVSTWLHHDVTSDDDWRRVIEEINRQWSRLDLLINSAGLAWIESIANATLEQWRRVLSVNLESVFVGMQAALPLMSESAKERTGGASIVNFTSIAGARGSQFGAAYGASAAESRELNLLWRRRAGGPVTKTMLAPCEVRAARNGFTVAR